MSLDEKSNGNPPPLVLAGFACLAALPLIHLAILPVARFIHVQWAEWLVFTLIPASAAFTVLYFSSWHQEFSRARRIYSGIVSSCVIYCVDLLVAGVLIAMGCLILALTR